MTKTTKTINIYRKVHTKLYAILALVALTTSLFPLLPTTTVAAIPKYINFQGKLTQVSNGSNVANGSYAFEFKIYDAASSGTLLWTETYDQASGPCTKLVVTNAIFNAKLGSCNALSIDFAGGSLHLSVNFAPTGTSYDGEMSPRKQLVASPFAFVANSLNGDGNIDLADFDVDSDGKTVIAPDTAGDALTVSNSATADIQGLVISSSNSTQTAGTIQVTSNTITDTAVLGMALTGTVQDAAGALTVYGNKTTLTVDTDAGSSHTAYGQHITIANNDTSSTAYGLYVDAGTGAGTEYAAAFMNGRVGIGTIAPTTALHVYEANGSVVGVFESNDSNNALFKLRNVNTNDSDGMQIGARSTEFRFDNRQSNGSITFYTDNGSTEAERVRISGAGNLGIGDSTPAAALTVGNGDLFQVNSSGSIAAVAGITNTGAQSTTVQSTTALTVARTGSNYALQVDTNTASSATGVKITAAAAAGGVAIAAISSGTDENITLDAKGAGTVSINGSATGNILFGGGSGSTGCTLTNSTGAFACTAAITGSNLSGTNTGDQTITLTGDVTGSGTGSFATTIGADKVLESNLKAVDSATDEECLTYETTTGDFEWQTCTVVTADSLDFIDFEDTLDLDASLTLNQGTNGWVQNYTGTTTTGLSYIANSLTSGTAISVSSSSLTSGALVTLSQTGDGAASNTQQVLNVSSSGNSNGTLTYGAAISNTHSGGGVNIALDLVSSGGGANYALYAASGNNYFGGNVGVGINAPTSQLHVQQTTDSTNTSTPIAFDVNSAGATGELTGTGAQTFARIAPVVNQSGAGGYTALLVNATETATGSSGRYLLDLQTDGASKFSVQSDGTVINSSTIFGGGDMYASSSGILGFSSRSRISSPTDSNLLVTNAAANAFNLLQFGGVSSSFPALKRSTTTLQARLADDSGYANLDASDYLLSGNSINTAGTLNNVAYLNQANVFTANQTITKADPSIVLNVTTATDTDFWLGVQDDAGGDDDDVFQIGDGTSPGTNPFLTINTSGNVGIGATSPSAFLHIGSNGATSNPGLKLSGSWFTGGDSTTTKPQLLVEASGATSTGWSTSGTGIGVNAPSGFAGKMIDVKLNGTTAFSLNEAGGISTIGQGITNFSATSGYWYQPAATVSVGNNGDSGASNLLLRAGVSGSSGGNITFNVNNSNAGIWNSAGFGIGTGTPIDPLSISTAINASATHALVNLSNTALSGASSNGTYLGANPGSNSADWINFQTGGANKFRVDSAGSVFLNAASSYGIQIGTLGSFSHQTASNFNQGGAYTWWQFAESSNWIDAGAYTQTYFAINPTYNPSSATPQTTLKMLDVSPTFNPSAVAPTVSGQWIAANISPIFGSGDELYNAGSTSPLVGLRVAPVINVGGSSTAGYTALLVNATETSNPGGTKLLADFQVGGVSKAKIDNTGALTVVSCTGCGGGATFDAIGDPTGNGSINMGTTVQTLDWGATTTTDNLTVTSSATGLTSGSALKVTSATTAAVTNGIVQLVASGAYTGTGGLLSVAANSTATGTIARVSGTALTSGTGLSITGSGATMTAAGELIDLAMGAATVGSGINVTTTGVYTGAGIVQLTANSATTGIVQAVSTTGLTTGSAMRLTGSGATMQTGGELADLVLGANTVGAGITITGTGAYTGTGSADGYINVVGNSLTTGYGSQYSFTGQTSGTGIRVTGGGANLLAAGELIDLQMGAATVGSGLNITTTGVYTGAGIAQLTANSATTGVIQAVSATGLTTGSAMRLTGSGATMQTGGELVDLVLGANTVGAGFTITGTGAYTGTGAADGYINVVGNSLTTGYGSQYSFTGMTSGTGVRISGGGANMLAAGELIDLQMGAATVGSGLNVTTSGAYTGAGILQLTANSATSGTIAAISATGTTTGSALSLTGPTATGITSGTSSGFLKVASDVGSGGTAGVLAYFNPDFSAGSATSGYGIYINGTDATAVGNTSYNLFNNLALTGNAAKVGVGQFVNVSTSSTTADTINGIAIATSATGIIGSGTRTQYGLSSQPNSSSANTGGIQNIYGVNSTPSTNSANGSTENVYGGYFRASGTVAAGTVNTYGLYVANPTMNTTGTSTKYGIYVEDFATTGLADNNYAAVFAGGNVGIGTITPSTRLHVLSTTEQLRLGYDTSNYTSFTVGATGALTMAQTGTGGAINLTASLASGNTTTAALNLKTSTNLAATDEVLQVGDSGGDFLTVLGNGYIGIGTTSPQEALTLADTSNLLLNSGYITTPQGGFGRSENRIKYTEEFDNAAWTKTGVTVTSNSIAGPDGFAIADTLGAGGSSTDNVRQSDWLSTSSTSTTWTGSVWLKKASGTGTVNLRLDSGNQTGTANPVTVTTSWQRFSVTQSFNGSSTGTVTFIINNGTTAYYAWGAQLEKQASVGVYVRNGSRGNTGTSNGLVINGREASGGAETATSNAITVNFDGWPTDASGYSTGMYIRSLNDIGYSPYHIRTFNEAYDTYGSIATSNVSGLEFSTGGVSTGARYRFSDVSNTFLTLNNNTSTNLFVIDQVDAQNSVAMYINTEESTTTQQVFAIETDALTDNTAKFAVMADGRVGVGTGSPDSLAQMDVVRDQNTFTLLRVHNPNAGSGASSRIVLGNNTANFNGQIIQSSSTETAFGGANSLNIYNSANAPIAFFTNAGSQRMIIEGGGDVGIGTTNPGYKLEVNGEIKSTLNTQVDPMCSTGGVIGSCTSDGRLKQNVIDLEDGALEEIMQLKPRYFDWINGAGDHQPGFIAQEVQAVLPDTFRGYTGDGYLKFSKDALVPYLTKALQELNQISLKYGSNGTIQNNSFVFEIPETDVNSAQITNTGNASVANTSFVINQKGSGNLLQLQHNGTDKLLITNEGTTTISTEIALGTVLEVKNNNNHLFSIDYVGTARLSGTLVVKKDLAVLGRILGSTAVVAKNTSSQTINQGDLVMLTGAIENPILGDQPTITISPAIAGEGNVIVGIADRNLSDFNIDPEAPKTNDETVIKPGEYASIVITGTYKKAYVTGPTSIGSKLTYSTTPGKAQKLENNTAGQVFGISLDATSSSDGSVRVMLLNSFQQFTQITNTISNNLNTENTSETPEENNDAPEVAPVTEPESEAQDQITPDETEQ